MIVITDSCSECERERCDCWEEHPGGAIRKYAVGDPQAGNYREWWHVKLPDSTTLRWVQFEETARHLVDALDNSTTLREWLTRPCPFCHEVSVLSLRPVDVARWESGELISTVWPDMSADDRELIITGTCDDCWNTNMRDFDESEDV